MIIRLFLSVALIITIAISTACATDRDYSTNRLSDAQHFRVSFRSEIEHPPINRLHQWVVHIETPDGHPVETARIDIGGGMPEHGHGLPTQPEMGRNLGHGDYEIDGIKFQMSGWWVVNFKIITPEVTDQVDFNLSLRE